MAIVFPSRNLNINKSSTENFVAASWELVTTRTPRLSRPFWCSQICRPPAEKSWEVYEEKKTSKNCPPHHPGKRSFTHFFCKGGPMILRDDFLLETGFNYRYGGHQRYWMVILTHGQPKRNQIHERWTNQRSSTNFLHGASLPLVRKAAGAFSDFFGHLHVDALGSGNHEVRRYLFEEGRHKWPFLTKDLSEQSIWCLVNDSDVNPALIWDMHTFIYTYIVYSYINNI